MEGGVKNMSYVRRVTYLESMFRDCATKEEIQTVDSLYALGNKGSAVVYMVKRVKKQWDAMLGKNTEVKPLAQPRTVKINEGGQTRITVIGR